MNEARYNADYWCRRQCSISPLVSAPSIPALPSPPNLRHDFGACAYTLTSRAVGPFSLRVSFPTRQRAPKTSELPVCVFQSLSTEVSSSSHLRAQSQRPPFNMLGFELVIARCVVHSFGSARTKMALLRVLSTPRVLFDSLGCYAFATRTSATSSLIRRDLIGACHWAEQKFPV